MWKTVVFSVLVCVLAVVYWIYAQFPPAFNVAAQLNNTYDYIIVGAGSAGCVLANRLTEDPDTTVLLLEAGDDPSKYPLTEIPLAFASFISTDAMWNDYTVPQKHACKDMKNQQCGNGHGKLLGGSSSLNAANYVRGSRHDYDGWAANGCTGWSYRDVLPYFIKSESNQNPLLVESGYHGKDGPMPVSEAPMTKAGEIFLEAVEKEFGIPVLDINGKSQFGFSRMQSTMSNDGRRSSTASTFLRQAMDRPNLHIATNALATKIIFDGLSAQGVEFTRDTKVSQVFASKEVIVSAGSIGSPKLLMLSGLGPKEHLEEFNIPVKVGLPVGDNLQDHMKSDFAAFHVDSDTLHFNEMNPLLLLEYFLYGTGMLAHSVDDALGFVRTNMSPPDQPYPDVQIFVSPFSYNSDRSLFSEERFYDEICRLYRFASSEEPWDCETQQL